MSLGSDHPTEPDHDGNNLADQVTPGVWPEDVIAMFFVVEDGIVDEQGRLVNLRGEVLTMLEAP